jgi:hypothetical protein
MLFYTFFNHLESLPDKVLWKRELDLVSPKIAAEAGINNEVEENGWYDSIRKLPYMY